MCSSPAIEDTVYRERCPATVAASPGDIWAGGMYEPDLPFFSILRHSP